MTKLSKKILIANKESIVCGWYLILKTAKKNKTKILSIDSELFSINEILKNTELNNIKKIFITASGGPFLNYKLSKFKNITPKQAIKHPKWKMGRKISIDSATLMNKMFEVIETKKLFNIPDNKIDILIHPESLIHALVQFNNGLTKLIYHETSMIIPIANAIFDEKIYIKDFLIKENKFIHKSSKKNLFFKTVDHKKFPIIKIKKKIDLLPSSSIIINACNEILVDQFLRGNIPFLAISKTIMTILKHRNYKEFAIKKPNHLQIIYKIDKWTRNVTNELLKKYK
jgi:1-deoxy-D-xylulose-5-phosphate reductoisomerase